MKTTINLSVGAQSVHPIGLLWLGCIGYKRGKNVPRIVLAGLPRKEISKESNRVGRKALWPNTSKRIGHYKESIKIWVLVGPPN